VTAFAEAPARDAHALPLAFDAAPRSGRAYIPGENPGAQDKIPDYPSSEGPGGRRSGEILAGEGIRSGAHAESQFPRGVAYGAGRLVWADAQDLLIWNPFASQVERKPLGNLSLLSGPDTILVSGWRTYLKTVQGVCQYDGLSHSLSMLSPAPFSSIAIYRGSLVGALKSSIVFITKAAPPIETKAPFEVVSLVGEGSTLGAFGSRGEVAAWNGEAWITFPKADAPSEFVQGWVVNNTIGVRTTSGNLSRVHYYRLSEPDAPVFSGAVQSDGPLSVVPGRVGFEQHRLIGFVGGSDSHLTVYHPGESSSMAAQRALGVSSLGATVAAIRRTSAESAIVVSAVDSSEDQVVFSFLRDGKQALPSPHFLPAGHLRSWLIPHREGLIVLSFDGKRSIVNNVAFPL
jgi:hypothetical protein